MKYAIDFGILNRNEFIVDEKRNQVKELDLKKDDLVLVEIGCPKGKLYQYAEKCKVLLIDGKETDKARKGKKTHKEDALTILRLHNEKPKLFKKLTVKDKEELGRIKQFKIYMRVTKTLAGIKNIQKAQQREYGEEVKDIDGQIKEFNLSKKEIVNRVVTGPMEYFKKSDVKEFIRKLKEELVCDFCKNHPKYNRMCSACDNAGIKIDKLAGEDLIS